MTRGLAAVIGISAGLILVACTDDPAPLPSGTDGGLVDVGSLDMDADALDATPEDATTTDAGLSADVGIIDLCNPFAQTGCPVDQKCIVERVDGGPLGAHCVPVGTSDLPLGAPCMGGDCLAGLACVTPTGTATVAHCVQLCDPMSRAGCENIPGDWECITRVRQSNWNACSELQPVCDPYSQVPCLPAQACQPYQHTDMSFDFRCRTAGPGGDNAACGGTTGMGCQRGLACVRDTGTMEGHCKILCQLNSDCPNMRQCSGTIVLPPPPDAGTVGDGGTPNVMYCGS